MNKLTLVLALALATVGCGTTRTYKAVSITDANEWSVKGEDMNITMESPLEPIKAMPEDRGTASAVIGGAASVAKFGLGMYFGEKMIDSLSATRDPLVVSPEVVSPEVIIP
jgi:hypothetical protein